MGLTKSEVKRNQAEFDNLLHNLKVKEQEQYFADVFGESGSYTPPKRNEGRNQFDGIMEVEEPYVSVSSEELLKADFEDIFG